MKKIVLLGSGFGNLGLIKELRKKKIKDIEIILISENRYKVNGDMFPPYVEGLYDFQDIAIDVREFCRLNQVIFIDNRIVQIDTLKKIVETNFEAISYDYLVLNLNPVNEEEKDSILYTNPLKNLIDLKMKLLRTKKGVITFVGGGTYNCELALAFKSLSKKQDMELSINVIEPRRDIATTFNLKGRSVIKKEFETMGIKLLTGKKIRKIENSVITMEDGSFFTSDYIIEDNVQRGPEITYIGMETTDKNYIRTDSNLRAEGQKDIFAMGELIIFKGYKLPYGNYQNEKQSKLIFRNLKALIGGKPLSQYTLSVSPISTLSLGSNRALVEYKGLSIEGSLAWNLKKFLDRRYFNGVKEDLNIVI